MVLKKNGLGFGRGYKDYGTGSAWGNPVPSPESHGLPMVCHLPWWLKTEFITYMDLALGLVLVVFHSSDMSFHSALTSILTSMFCSWNEPSPLPSVSLDSRKKSFDQRTSWHFWTPSSLEQRLLLGLLQAPLSSPWPWCLHSLKPLSCNTSANIYCPT